MLLTLLLEHPWMMLLTALLSSWLITVTIIPVVIRVAREKHLMDEPNVRSSHDQKTPSLGGVAIFAAIAIVFTVLTYGATPSEVSLFQILPSLVILFFIGLKDDILVIDPIKKLIAQLLAGSLFIIFSNIRVNDLYGLFGFQELPYIASFVITLFIFVAITNAYNLIDGIDGLAGCLGGIAALTYGIYFLVVDEIRVAVLCFTLVGALAGFLKFNFSANRKIFMGDSGSLVVGFVLSVLAVRFVQFNQNPSEWYISNAPTVAIAILGIPLFDTLRVFSQRVARRVSPFTADRHHIHHFFVDNGISHRRSSIWLSFISFAIIGVSLYFSHASVTYSLGIMVLLFVIYAGAAQRDLIVRQAPPPKEIFQKPPVFTKKEVFSPNSVAKSEATPPLNQPQSARATG